MIRLCRNDSDYLSASHLGMAKVDFQKTGIHSFQKSGPFNAVYVQVVKVFLSI